MHQGITPGPAARGAAEWGYEVADEREAAAPQKPSMTRARSSHAFTQGAREVATAMNKARARKTAAAATGAANVMVPPNAAIVAAAGGNSNSYSLHDIAVGDVVGGVVTHTSWVGPFVNIGTEVEGFIDPVTLSPELVLQAGDLICGLRVELVDPEKPKLLLDGANARTMTLGNG